MQMITWLLNQVLIVQFNIWDLALSFALGTWKSVSSVHNMELLPPSTAEAEYTLKNEAFSQSLQPPSLPKALLNEGVPNFSTASPQGKSRTGGSVETRHREECEHITHI